MPLQHRGFVIHQQNLFKHCLCPPSQAPGIGPTHAFAAVLQAEPRQRVRRRAMGFHRAWNRSAFADRSDPPHEPRARVRRRSVPRRRESGARPRPPRWYPAVPTIPANKRRLQHECNQIPPVQLQKYSWALGSLQAQHFLVLGAASRGQDQPARYRAAGRRRKLRPPHCVPPSGAGNGLGERGRSQGCASHRKASLSLPGPAVRKTRARTDTRALMFSIPSSDAACCGLDTWQERPKNAELTSCSTFEVMPMSWAMSLQILATETSGRPSASVTAT